MSWFLEALKAIGPALKRPLWPHTPEIAIPADTTKPVRWWDVLIGAVDVVEGTVHLLVIGAGALGVFGWFSTRWIS